MSDQLTWPDAVAFVGNAFGVEEPTALQCSHPNDELPVLLFDVEEGDVAESVLKAAFYENETWPVEAMAATYGRILVVANPGVDGTLKFGGCSIFPFTFENSVHIGEIEFLLDERWSRTSPRRDEEPLPATVDELIAQPHVFANRVVQTRGYARFSWEHCCILYADKETRRRFDNDHAVGLQLIPLSTEREPLLASHGGPIASLRPFAIAPAVVTGTFVIGDASSEMRVGSLVNVTTFAPLARDGEDDELAATFDQGMEHKLAPSEGSAP